MFTYPQNILSYQGNNANLFIHSLNSVEDFRRLKTSGTYKIYQETKSLRDIEVFTFIYSQVDTSRMYD